MTVVWKRERIMDNEWSVTQRVKGRVGRMGKSGEMGIGGRGIGDGGVGGGAWASFT